MIIGIGNTVPEIVNLPGQGGEVILLTISYPSSAFCPSASDPTPTVSGNVGAGTFSSTAGLVFVDSGGNTGSSTGEINISASTPGATYTITYTDTNSAVATTPLTLNALDNATFSYLASSFAQDASNPSPIFPSGAITGGTFSAGSGLIFVDSGSNINSSTGEINLSASTIASYTITYDTTSSPSTACPNTSTFTVAVTAAVPALAQINNVYSMEFDGASDISIGPRPSLNATPFTWSFWINYTSTTTRAIYSQGSSSLPFTQTAYLAVNGTALTVYLGSIYITGTGFLTENEWQHVVVTRDSSSVVRLYRNGVVFESAGKIMGGSQPASNGSIGSWTFSSGTGTYFTGKIDEGAIWDIALTDAEILNIYNATEIVSGVNKTADLSQLTTPPVAWYRM